MRGFGHSLREPKPRPSGSMLVTLASSSKTSYCMRFAHGGFCRPLFSGPVPSANKRKKTPSQATMHVNQNQASVLCAILFNLDHDKVVYMGIGASINED